MNIDSAINELQTLDWKGILSEYVFHNLFDFALKKAKGTINNINESNKDKKPININIDVEEVQEFLSHHYKKSINWATEISFRDATTAKFLSDIFIELDLLLSPKKLSFYKKNEQHERYPLSETLDFEEKNIVLLGQPGAGKTTISKKIFLDLIRGKNEKFEMFNFPLVIRLKEFFNAETKTHIFKVILEQLGVSLTFSEDDWNLRDQENIEQIIVTKILDDLKILLILDGFDEITQIGLREELLMDLEQIALSTNDARFILTSRTGDFDFHISRTQTFEICPLNEAQINEFAVKWLSDENKSSKFLSQLENSPYWDTMMRPLTLAHLCALFERENKIPEKPKSIYQKIIHLLLEDWNNQRMIERVSQYGGFDSYRKYEFLSNLAYLITVEWGLNLFKTEHIEISYEHLSTNFNLPKNQVKKVVSEIESHNGLIIQIGQNTYEFAHKSLQEYMVADYLSKIPFIPNDNDMLISIPNELAIATAISIKPSYFLFSVFMQQLKVDLANPDFLNPFIERINLEKPDFENHEMFALSIIYAYNIFVKKYADIIQAKQKQLSSNAEKMEHRLIHNTLKNILSLTKMEIFKPSFRLLKKNYYHISDVNLSPQNDMYCLNRYGKIVMLKAGKLKDKIVLHKRPFKIPKILYLPKGQFNIR